MRSLTPSYLFRPAALDATVRILLGTLLVVPFLGASTPADATASRPRHASTMSVTYGTLPLRFEPNVGQTDPRVRFLAHGNGYTLFLTDTGALFALGGGGLPSTGARDLLTHLMPFAPRGAARERAPAVAPVVAAMRISLVGANSHPLLEGESRLPGVASYFIGSDPRRWHAGVPTYGRVVIHDVYRGIDQVYHSRHGQLEYDFVVRPGADPAAIRLAVAGARMRRTATGDLVLTTPAGSLVQRAPQVSQERPGGQVMVPGGYRLDSLGMAGFTLGAYDHRRALVIDPLLSYATYLGGAADETGAAVAVDGKGDAYVTGSTLSPTFPTTTGAVRRRFGGGYPFGDAFVAKLNPTGTALLYATYLGGKDDDSGADIALDPAGDAYVTGSTASNDFPTTPGALQRTYGGFPGDAFMAKLNPSGTALLYATYLGGSSVDAGYGIAVDRAGSAYVTGLTYSADFLRSPGTARHVFHGNAPDAFVAKLSASGSALIYCAYVGGSDLDAGVRIAVDGSGHAYITGFTRSRDLPMTRGAAQPRYAGGGQYGGDAFVAKLNPSGTVLVYATYLGGTGDDSGADIAVDAAGNAYVTGSTTSSDFHTTPGGLQRRYGGGANDTFVAKLNPTGTALVYATYLGGRGDDSGFGIAIAKGDAYIVGATSSRDFPVSAPALQRMSAGGTYDAFIARLNATGMRLDYATYLGGSNLDIDSVYPVDEAASGIALDRAGDIYVAGSTRARDFPVSRGALQPASAGMQDIFVGRVLAKSIAATPRPTPPMPPTASGRLSDGAAWRVLNLGAPEAPVALSADGSLALIGSSVYHRPASGWAAPLTVAATLPLACPPASAALSADGSTAIVQDTAGTVDLFTHPGAGWHGTPSPAAVFPASLFRSPSEQTSPCPQILDDAVTVALSGDGSVAVVGAAQGNRLGGAVVYQRGSARWTSAATPVAHLNSTPSVPKGVAVSADAGVILVGNTVFERGAAGWADRTSPNATLAVGNKPTVPGEESATLSADGSTVLIADGYLQTIHVFVRGPATWSGQAAPARSFDFIASQDSSQDGYGLALSYDGSIALIAPSGIIQGPPYLVFRPGAGWSGRGGVTVPLPIAGSGSTWVALSGDGATGLVAEGGTDRQPGRGYLLAASPGPQPAGEAQPTSTVTRAGTPALATPRYCHISWPRERKGHTIPCDPAMTAQFR